VSVTPSLTDRSRASTSLGSTSEENAALSMPEPLVWISGPPTILTCAACGGQCPLGSSLIRPMGMSCGRALFVPRGFVPRRQRSRYWQDPGRGCEAVGGWSAGVPRRGWRRGRRGPVPQRRMSARGPLPLGEGDGQEREARPRREPARAAAACRHTPWPASPGPGPWRPGAGHAMSWPGHRAPSRSAGRRQPPCRGAPQWTSGSGRLGNDGQPREPAALAQWSTVTSIVSLRRVGLVFGTLVRRWRCSALRRRGPGRHQRLGPRSK
jgi:hypothetical protein